VQSSYEYEHEDFDEMRQLQVSWGRAAHMEAAAIESKGKATRHEKNGT
jgi:hypothetical protein